MPGLVTIFCHAECLGAWTYFWEPCRGMWPFAYGFRFAVKMPPGRTGTQAYGQVFCDLVSRSDICGWRWHMNVKGCVEATIEHLAWLLYSKFVHYTFTIAAFRIMKGRLTGSGMTLQASYVLLKLL
eukprot:5103454-Amphidinium_carterae.2